MCGRFAVTESNEDILDDFKISLFNAEEFPIYPAFNIAPTTQIGIITRSLKDQGMLRYSSARWGLVPSWADSIDIGTRMINARSEKALSGPIYKNLIKTRRCIIPVSAWYEWMARPGGGKQPFALKHPEKFYFAGLYDFWRSGENAPWQLTTTILTQAATDKASEVHDRMPIMLNDEGLKSWLNNSMLANEALDSALSVSQELAKELLIWKVSWRVNRVSESGKELLDEYIEDGLPFGI